MSAQIPSFSVFPNGTSHTIWLDRNCDRCVKRYDERKHHYGTSDCDIENAISIASATDGTLRRLERHTDARDSESGPTPDIDEIADRIETGGVAPAISSERRSTFDEWFKALDEDDQKILFAAAPYIDPNPPFRCCIPQDELAVLAQELNVLPDTIKVKRQRLFKRCRAEFNQLTRETAIREGKCIPETEEELRILEQSLEGGSTIKAPNFADVMRLADGVQIRGNIIPNRAEDRVMTLAEVQREMPDESILISNMKGNGYDKIVVSKTPWKSIHPLGKKDKVIKPPCASG